MRCHLTVVMCLGLMTIGGNEQASGEEPATGPKAASGLESNDETVLGSSLSAVLALFRDRRIGLDRDAAKSTVEEALIKSADPRAVIMNSDDVPAFRTGVAALSKSEDTDVHVEMLESGAVYVKLVGLFKGTGEGLLGRIRAHSGDNVFGCILDLREAAGEDLDSVCALASLFLTVEQDLFLVTNCVGGEARLFRSSRTGAAGRLRPAVVLTGADTCGASELLAAVLKGASGVLIVGSGTRGDARLREIVPLDGRRSVYIATRLLVPVGKGQYDGSGVEPDIQVDPGRDLNQPADNTNGEESEGCLRVLKSDLLLSRASDIVLGLKALGAGVPSERREGLDEEKSGQ